MIYINIIIPAKPFLQPLQVYKVALYALGFTDGLDGKESACNAGDPGSISGSGRSPGGGHSNPLLYSCLENPVDREAWLAAVHKVAESWTRLKRLNSSLRGILVYNIWLQMLDGIFYVLRGILRRTPVGIQASGMAGSREPMCPLSFPVVYFPLKSSSAHVKTKMDIGICGHTQVLQLSVLEEKVRDLSLAPTQPSSPFFKPHGGLWLPHSWGQSLQTRVFLCVMSGHAWTISSHLWQSIRTTQNGRSSFLVKAMRS